MDFWKKNAPLQSSSSTPHSNLSKSKSLVTDIRKKKTSLWLLAELDGINKR